MAPLEIAAELCKPCRMLRAQRYDTHAMAWVTVELDLALDATDDEILESLAKINKGKGYSVEVHEPTGDVRLWDGRRWRYVVGVSEEAIKAMLAEDEDSINEIIE